MHPIAEQLARELAAGRKLTPQRSAQARAALAALAGTPDQLWAIVGLITLASKVEGEAVDGILAIAAASAGAAEAAVTTLAAASQDRAEAARLARFSDLQCTRRAPRFGAPTEEGVVRLSSIHARGALR